MAYKRILTIQDISCVGQCSMTVAQPVLSACGLETCILPTAMLSTHTGGFGMPAIMNLTQAIPDIRHHWMDQRITFDAIYTGYLGSMEAIEQAKIIFKTLLAPGGIIIADPAMADHGKLYSGFDDCYARAMTELCSEADIILPNMTEAAMMSGLPFEGTVTEPYISELLEGLHHPCVLLTGAGAGEKETGVAMLDHGNRQDYRHRKLEKSYHGTGDLFASCFIGAYLQGKPLAEAVSVAADTVFLAIENTLNDPDHWYGVKFETVIPQLVQRIF